MLTLEMKMVCLHCLWRFIKVKSRQKTKKIHIYWIHLVCAGQYKIALTIVKTVASKSLKFEDWELDALKCFVRTTDVQFCSANGKLHNALRKQSIDLKKNPDNWKYTLRQLIIDGKFTRSTANVCIKSLGIQWNLFIRQAMEQLRNYWWRIVLKIRGRWEIHGQYILLPKMAKCRLSRCLSIKELISAKMTPTEPAHFFWRPRMVDNKSSIFEFYGNF